MLRRAWQIIDNFSGYQTSTVLSQALVSYVARELKQADKTDPASIDKAITDGFIKLDDDIVKGALDSVNSAGSRPRAEVIADIAPAISGAMAILAIYDPETSTLRVASVGDSQAVLGQKAAEGPATWTAVPLSTPQTPDRPDELARIHEQHPGEPDSDLFTADGKRLLVSTRPFFLPSPILCVSGCSRVCYMRLRRSLLTRIRACP